MKKLLMCFFAMMVYAPAVLCADGVMSRIIPSDTNTKSASTHGGRTVSTGARATSARTTTNQTKDTSNNASNVRSTVSRVFSGSSGQSSTSDVTPRSNIVSRSAISKTSDSRAALDSAVNTVGRNSRTSAASINSNPAVRRAGLVLRPSTAEVGGRAIIGDTGVQTGSNIDESIRKIRGRSATTAETLEETRTRLEQAAELNKTCQDQYNECMDQFCAVIDANQKRCSCSSNLKQYAKVEEAVKTANTQLNEIAQRIRYVGLSADEISAIMTETEAEEALSGTTDTSETRSMLDEIEDLISDPKITTTSYSSDSSFGGLDIDLDFSGDSADIFSLDFLGNDNSTSFSNLRGADLYKAAKKRCATVLNQCKDAGATSAQITGNYDLAIDKDCIAYEQGLVKMNDTLKSNVRSANLMLQKARLAVQQNKNQYDAKGCIAALNTCMTDDMVCGSDYFKCVDPTKRFIDENGEVVLGQDISNITAFMQEYNNANINQDFLSDAADMEINAVKCSDTDGNDGSCVASYLLSKIGTGQKITDGGLCRAVLDKCQAYTYDENGDYKPYNDVVVNYVQRAMVNIRAAQHQIISDYASSCMVDIANCYNQQVSQLNSWSSSTSVGGIYNVMRGACRNVALTCAYAVFDKDIDSCPEPDSGATPIITEAEAADQCITSISEMFYNSLLCEEGYVYKNGECVNPDTEVYYGYNGFADGYNSTAVKQYLIKNKSYRLPAFSELNPSENPINDDAFLHHRSWCYKISDTELHCVPLGYMTTAADGDYTDGSKRYNVTPYTVISIPLDDVNTMLERGDTNVYLSLASTTNLCNAKSWTILDEQGCRCMSGKLNSSGSCVEPEDKTCPAGYTENTTAGVKNCAKDGIKLTQK